MRAFRGLILALLAGSLLFVLAAWLTARPGDPSVFPPRPGEAPVTIYVVYGAFHSELALPSSRIREHGGPAAAALARLHASPWVLVGWGDAAFYAGAGWSASRAGEGLRAILGLSGRSAVRLTPVSRRPDLAFPGEALRVELSQAGFERLLRRLDGSLRTRRGAPVVIAQRPGAVYVESREHFSLLKLCNSWAGELLSVAGAPTTPALHLLPRGLIWDLKLHDIAATAHAR